jgi:coenzyme F420-reducing hydrogenase gamma subunit
VNSARPRIAVHKFASCDGCQLAFLNAGEALLTLAQRADIVHFAEAGWNNPLAEVDIAFVEGSISTPHDLERIRAVRESALLLVTIGACATAGGLQALRNGLKESASWVADVYASPEYIQSLPESRPVSAHVKVDLELWGCPVTSEQVLAATADLLNGITPVNPEEPVCVECKRRGQACVLVTKNAPCMGPVTRTGCGALCPGAGRACYGCFGPAELPNAASMAKHFEQAGLEKRDVARRFLFITSTAAPFSDIGLHYRDQDHE